MTIVDDRPEVDRRSPEPPLGIDRSTSPTATWRFAARLARREVRRRPGRTLLVMLLVAVPVLGMTIGSIAARTTNESVADQYARRFGAADLTFSAGPRVAFDEIDGQFTVSEVVQPNVEPGVGVSDTVAAASYPFPPGTRAITTFDVGSPVRGIAADGRTQRPYVSLYDVDVTDPLSAGMFVVDDGRLPVVSTEVMLDDDLAERFGVGIGDTLELTRPAMDLVVTGIGRSSAQSNDVVLIPGFDRSLVSAGFGQVDVLLDLPDSMAAAEVDALADRLAQAGLQAQTPTRPVWFQQDDLEVTTLAWGWVAGVVAFIAVGIVIAAAFASTARRQLVTIGQLSANGAPQRLVRRTLGLQGLWTGVLGAGLGLTIGVIGMLFSTPVLEIVGNRPFSGVRIEPLDLIVIAITALVAATTAALVPARSASRLPVLAALAGRRPLATPPSWLVPVGLALFAGGLFLLGATASNVNGGNFAAATGVLGGVGVLFGIVCCSPLIVAAVGHVGAKRGGIVMLASRSLSRSRARSAGVMTAIAVVASLAIAGLTTAGSVESQTQSGQGDLSVVTLDIERFYGPPQFDAAGEYIEEDLGPIVPTELSGDLRADIESILPDATWIPVLSAIEDPLTSDQYPRNAVVVRPVVATPEVIRLAGLNDEEVEHLDNDGIVATAPWLAGSRTFVATVDGLVELDAGPILREFETNEFGDVLGSQNFRYGQMFISATYAQEHGLDVAVQRYVIDNPRDLTRAQRNDLDQIRPPGFGGDSFVPEASADGGSPDSTSGWYLYFDRPQTEIPWALLQLIVLAAALLAVLLMVAIGLSLAATESRDERDVLHTVGAPPKVLRRVAAAKAWVLATGAAVVAIPAGYLVVRVITWVNGDSAPVPWIGIAGVLIVVPALAAVATLGVSALAQRFRPITVSTMILD